MIFRIHEFLELTHFLIVHTSSFFNQVDQENWFFVLEILDL